MASRNIQMGLSLNPSQFIAGMAYSSSAAKGFENVIRGVGSSVSSIGRTLSILSVPIGAGLFTATKDAIAFESQLSAVSRALDLTDAETASFKTTIFDLSSKVGILPQEFAKFIEEAGKLGVPKAEIQAFAEVVATTQAATQAGAIGISQNFAAIRAIFRYSITDIEKYAATINALDDKIGGTFITISEFVERTGSTGKLVGLTADQLAAMGATFARLGVTPDRAATSINTFINRLTGADLLTNDAQEALARLGYSSDSLRASLTKDFNSGMLEFFERIRKLKPEDQLVQLAEIFGREASDEIATLVTGYESYAEALAVIVQQTENLAKLQAEQDKKLAGTTGQINILKASWEKLSIIVGDVLLPPLNEILKTLIPIVENMAKFAQENPKITKTAVAIGAVLIVVAPLTLLLGSLITSFAALAPIIGFALSPISLLVAGLASVYFYMTGIEGITSAFQKVGSAFNGIGEFAGNLGQRTLGSEALQSSGVNINFAPNYNISGLANQAIDATQGFLQYVKRNDRQFLTLLQDVSSRIGRSIF